MTVRSRPAARFRIAPCLPGDKSVTHRALILGALARGSTRIENPNPGSDCRATRRALEDLGVRVAEGDGTLEVEGSPGNFRAPARPLDLGNSGTGLRLLLGALAAFPQKVVLTGDASLSRRPVERVLAPLRAMGARAEAPGDHLPVTLTGGELAGLRHRLPVPSAQVKSALLLAGLQARGETWIGGTRGTRDHTERLLRYLGVRVEEGEDWVSVRGGQIPEGKPVRVPGDLSAGVFYLVAAAVCPGSLVTLEGVGLNPTRNKALAVLSNMGMDLEVVPADTTGPEPTGSVRAVLRGSLSPFDLGPGEIPGLVDELPALAVAAAFADGTSRLAGAGELRVKESDRLAAMAEGLEALGARIRLQRDGWTVEGSGGETLSGGRAYSRGDHRVAMALLVAGLHCRGGTEILDTPMIETSDPYFQENLGAIEEDET